MARISSRNLRPVIWSVGIVVCHPLQSNPFTIVTLTNVLGLVLGDRIVDTRSEWRTFANDENGDDPSRVGAVADPLLNGSQLDTVISARDGYSGRAKELSRAQSKNATTKSERNLIAAYKEIGAMSEAIGLPKVVSDIAKQLYKKIEDEKTTQGENHSKYHRSLHLYRLSKSQRSTNVQRNLCSDKSSQKRDWTSLQDNRKTPRRRSSVECGSKWVGNTKYKSYCCTSKSRRLAIYADIIDECFRFDDSVL